MRRGRRICLGPDGTFPMDESNPPVHGSSDSDPPELPGPEGKLSPGRKPRRDFRRRTDVHSCRPCSGKPRDIMVTNRDTVSRKRFPAGLSPAIRIGYGRQFRNKSREKFGKEKPGNLLKRFPAGFPTETVRLYSKYVRTRQARRKRGEKRKSVSGIKTGKIPGKIPGILTGIIRIRIPLPSSYASRAASSSEGGSFGSPFPLLVRDETIYGRHSRLVYRRKSRRNPFAHVKACSVRILYLRHTSVTPFIASVTPLSHPESPDRIFRTRRETLWSAEPFLRTCTRMSRLFLRKSPAGKFPPRVPDGRPARKDPSEERYRRFRMPAAEGPGATSPGAFTCAFPVRFGLDAIKEKAGPSRDRLLPHCRYGFLFHRS